MGFPTHGLLEIDLSSQKLPEEISEKSTGVCNRRETRLLFPCHSQDPSGAHMPSLTGTLLRLLWT